MNWLILLITSNKPKPWK